ncbi:MAG: N-acetyl-gamma-glutamyl-phosphate reductase [Deinococcota bacterium]
MTVQTRPLETPPSPSTQTYNVGILGASGYGGSGLLRRLQHHPNTHVVGIASRQYLGKPVSACWPQFAAQAFAEGLLFTSGNDVVDGCDVLLSAAPHGSVSDLVAKAVRAGKTVIDLAADFRLPASDYKQWYGHDLSHPDVYAQSIYGLVELHREEIKGASFVANPGCNATAGALALLPLAAHGLVGKHTVVNIVTGISGAGRSASMGTHFGELNENVIPYKVAGTHRHTAEIELSLGRARAFGKHAKTHAPSQIRVDRPVISFSPHLVPMTRGILASCYTHPEMDALASGEKVTTESVLELYHQFYQDDPLITVQDALPQTKATYGSDRVIISARVDERSGHIAAFAAEDNLGKGAAGQAVQNFNVMQGLEETLGLFTEAVYP